MEKINMKEMKRGYFIGNFEPSAYRTDEVEICCKGASKYTLDAGYYRKKDVQFIFLNRGMAEINGIKYKKYDLIKFEPGEVINIFALTNIEMTIIRFPGTKGDLNKVVWNDFDEMNSFYHSYLDRLIKLHEEPDNCKKGKSISSKDVSVVIQGYADSVITKNTIESVRKYLPDSKVILSTWKECDCSQLDYDEVILNEDPGACECGLYAMEPIANNGNRQILSTKKGLEKVKTKYALKLRSDLVLLGNDFLRYTNVFPEYKKDVRIFKERIVIGELFTRNDFVYYDPNGYKHKVPKPFHPSDWFFFGLTEDLNTLYDAVTLIPENEMANYECNNKNRVENNKYKYSWRYTTEQHIMLGCVRNKLGFSKFADWTDWDDEIIEYSKEVMLNNFTILDFCQHKILNQKYIPASFANSGVCYKEWNLMTNKQLSDYYKTNFQ